MSVKLLKTQLHNLRAYIKYEEDTDSLIVELKNTKSLENDEWVTIHRMGFKDFGRAANEDVTIRFSMYNSLHKAVDIASITIPFYPGNYEFEEVVLPLIFRSDGRVTQNNPIIPRFVEVKHYQNKNTHYVWKDNHNAHNFMRMVITGKWTLQPWPLTHLAPGTHVDKEYATYMDD
ncbi:hypothetical protein SM033_00018 [Vibrio phage vB_VpaM_sm033]|nr:hypothetical protein SM033_00018 [Vibrio phage vB_VpaM_sm033]